MKRSVLALVGSLVGLGYAAGLTAILLLAAEPPMAALHAAGLTIQYAALLPHLAAAALANLVHWIGFAARRRGFALAAALLYLASVPLMPGLFPVPMALSLLALIDFARRTRRARICDRSISQCSNRLIFVAFVSALRSLCTKAQYTICRRHGLLASLCD